jgi:hypothetical protein
MFINYIVYEVIYCPYILNPYYRLKIHILYYKCGTHFVFTKWRCRSVQINC